MQLFSRRTKPRPFSGEVPAPDRVGIESTRFCNLRCAMCLPYQNGSTVRGPHMDMDTFRRLGDAIFPFVKYWQPTVSGEPTVSPHFVEMVEEAGRHGVRVDLFTNGTRLKPEQIERIAPHLARVYVSFDSADPETFEAIRAGAKFERVRQTVRDLVRICHERIPAEDMPILALNATLMRRNIEGLPDLVDFAREEGIRLITVGHVYPENDEFKGESLVHDVPLARRRIEAALARAEACDVTLHVQALDHLIAATVLGEGVRGLSVSDGVVEGMEHRAWIGSVTTDIPPARHTPEQIELRERASATASYPAPVPPPTPTPPARKPSTPAPAWYCDFLWERSYVDVGGDVRPCCVPGAPILGNVRVEPFDRIWNGEHYRALRTRLAARDPVSVCKGCQHIRTADEPDQIHRVLQGASTVAVERDVPPTLQRPALGAWLGWLKCGDENGRIEIRLDSEHAGRAIVPAFSRAWIALRDVSVAPYAAAFRADGLGASFQGTLGSGHGTMDFTVTFDGGRVEALRVTRVPVNAAMAQVEHWNGTVAGPDGPEELRLALGVTGFREQMGRIDWPAQRLADAPVDVWESREDGFDVYLLVEGRRMHLRCERRPGAERATGFAYLQGREDGAIELLLASEARTRRPEPEVAR